MTEIRIDNGNRIGFSEIKEKYLPHRYPILMLDRITDYRAGEFIEAIKCVTGNSPELVGHAGMLVIVGYGLESVRWNMSKLMVYDAEIRGTWGCPPEHYPYILDRVLAGDIQIAPMVETRPMSRIAATFEEGRTHGNPGKRVVLVPDF